ncbi:hypothetical protein PAHAL_2G332500 [Panicum hallii]|uniref:Rx N-terminal domain-containing protein n=2 Tax=Panicum hallii TaxID=206008 RepID=A0A2S3H1C4_9POAL|nr:disease resistance protein RPM1-like isoform X2 [Panicum hallii]PAN13379.1 hypothetical protein PAHAL_2G332500 [Panicum hallii]
MDSSPVECKMEATALSLARSVLHGILSSARAAVFDEVARLIGVPNEVDFVRSELEMMQAFLGVVYAHPDAAGRTETVRTWVKQVRDLAYDVEDCLLDFALYAARASSSRAGSLLPGAIAERHRIAERIRDLKARVEQLNQRNLRYRIVVDSPAAGAAAEQAASSLPEHDANSAELAFQESDIIGRLDEKAKLTELISGAEPGEAAGRRRRMPLRGLVPSFWFNHVVEFFCVPTIGGPTGEAAVIPTSPRRPAGTLRVVSVWGMGGMGKSSLVWAVHNDPVLLDEFDCGAWVTVPHPLDNPEVFRRRLRKELGVARNQDLGQYLREKRYRVIVDDVHTNEEWDAICQVFQFRNSKGSRIIVTTRREDVARHCTKHVYELKPLGDAESMDLLCQKVYKTTEYTLPEDMAEQAKHILRRCRGLPLAISTIGGLLANRPKTSIEWRNLHEHLGAELESDLRNIPKVIVSSYDGLPYDLKSIFLYLSIFPENHEIRRTRLLRRWMAEGYIAKKRDMPVEDVAARSYTKLINRSMIQPSKVSPGETDRCRIHSMVLQIILSRFIEENQLFLVEEHSNEARQSKIRHLVVSRWKSRDEKLQNINMSYIRSLTIFGEYPSSLISPKMRLLRVLDLEDTVNMKNDDLKHIGELQHLRYLSLRGTDISKLPSSLQNLRYLETLDIQDTRVRQLPSSIVKLEDLRYLVAGVNFTKDLLQKMRDSRAENHEARLFGDIEAYLGCNRGECCEVSNVDHLCVRVPEGIEKLKNLHMLGAVNVARVNGVSGRFKKLMNLTTLRRLGVTGLTEEEGQDLCKSIGGLSQLQRLELRCVSIRFPARMDEPEIPRHLTSMRLCGKLIGMPEWISSLNNLATVKLLGTRLNQEDIMRLQNLRNLAFLGLWEDSYIEESLRFSASTFTKLKVLDIDGLENIRTMTIREGAMPQLELLWLNKCHSLHDNSFGVSGVQYLQSLKELLLKNCGEKQNLIDILQEQVNRHTRRPKFLIGKSRVVL